MVVASGQNWKMKKVMKNGARKMYPHLARQCAARWGKQLGGRF